jgi:hypothetical protein
VPPRKRPTSTASSRGSVSKSSGARNRPTSTASSRGSVSTSSGARNRPTSRSSSSSSPVPPRQRGSFSNHRQTNINKKKKQNK